ncbi:MAG: FAD-dependent oxidoreductase [Ruminococcaceae bacterium]|nr:FAD-dependent oxidoreductase [Oscillospiraceae bacterium]
MHDIIIVGAGPAGLTAAIYARRAGKSVLVLERDTFGGQITYSPKLENYPAFQEISGNELAQRMLEQALSLGADIDMDNVVNVIDGDVKLVVGENGTYEAKAVIIAAGAKHRRLGLPNEDQFIGNGISFCAVCDGAFYAGQHVAVIGGGNTALQEVLLLSETCSKVTVVQNLAFLTGEANMIEALKSRTNVEYIYSTVVTGYCGEDALTAIELLNTKTNEASHLEIDGIFLAIGTEPENDAYRAVAELNDYGYILADERCLTKTNGIFVAGDCRTKAYRQVATAISDGATAALTACRFLDQ